MSLHEVNPKIILVSLSALSSMIGSFRMSVPDRMTYLLLPGIMGLSMTCCIPTGPCCSQWWLKRWLRRSVKTWLVATTHCPRTLWNPSYFRDIDELTRPVFSGSPSSPTPHNDPYSSVLALELLQLGSRLLRAELPFTVLGFNLIYTEPLYETNPSCQGYHQDII